MGQQRWSNFELIEHKKNRFVVSINGVIVRSATKFDHQFYEIVEASKNVDGGDIEISLAIAAVATLLASADIATAFRAIALIGFILAIFASASIVSLYLVNRIPHIMFEAYKRKFISPSSVWYLSKVWLVLLISNFGNMGPHKEVEFGYLNLLASFALVGTGAITWVFASFVNSLS